MRALRLTIAALLISLAGFAQKAPPRSQAVMVKFANGREQFAIRIDTSFYWLRYNRIVPIKKKVVSFKPFKDGKVYQD